MASSFSAFSACQSRALGVLKAFHDQRLSYDGPSIPLVLKQILDGEVEAKRSTPGEATAMKWRRGSQDACGRQLGGKFLKLSR